MTDHDPLDERLRSYAARWRSDLPHPPALDVDLVARAVTVRSHTTRWLVAVAAAVVLAAIIGVTIGTRGSSQHSAPPPADTTPGVVPWRPLPATHPTLPMTTVPASPDPAAAVAARACTSSDLRHSRPQLEGAAGTTYLIIRLSLAGTSPCRLEGYPDVVLLDHGDPIHVEVEHSPTMGTGKVEPVLVTTANPAVLTLGWSVSHHCPAVDNDEVRVTLGAGFAPFAVHGFGQSTCTPGEGSAALLVAPIQPRDSRPAEETSPYDAIRVSGDLDLDAQPNQPVHFVITLTSPDDLVLNPCPDYQILTSAGTVTYALNCAAVPHRDGQDRPYLPAGVPVQFAMQADPGTQTTPKFLWTLLPSGPTHTVAGMLTVAGSEPDARLSGSVMMVGGPAGSDRRKVGSGTVRAIREDGLIRTASIEGAMYNLMVPPGTYRIEVESPQLGRHPDCTPTPVVVEPGRNVEANLTCQIR